MSNMAGILYEAGTTHSSWVYGFIPALCEKHSLQTVVVNIKYLFMFQNDYKRLGHSVIRSIDCCMSIENSNDMSYRDQKWVSGIRYELDSIHNRWESEWMFCSYYLSYCYCSSKLVLAHAVLLKKNIWNQFCFRVCQQLKELNIHYLFGSNIVFQTQTCLRTKFWLENVILTVDTATMIR
jgi:hypothetical protein